MHDTAETQSTENESATKIVVQKEPEIKSNGEPSNHSEQSANNKEEAGDAAEGKDSVMDSSQDNNKNDDSGSDGEGEDDDDDVDMKDAEDTADGEDGAENDDSAAPSVAASDADSDMDDSSDEKDGDTDPKKENGGTNGAKEESELAESAGASASTAGNQASSGGAPASTPPPPVLRGTLSYSMELRRHLIRGMWNYENSNAFPPQRFELLRNLEPSEDPTVLPVDGEFHGSFSLAYFHTTSKGKQKERSKVIPESGVNIKFTKLEGEEMKYQVDGKGTNQFGVFHINGDATLSPHDDGQFDIVLRKRYEPSSQPAAPLVDGDGGKKFKKRKMGSMAGGSDFGDTADDGPLPPPSQSFDKNVVCLRGKLYKEESDDLGLTEVVHRIDGMWSPGLDLILADPQNTKGLCNRFEYEHKSSAPSATFPVSGRYSGWFDLNLEDGSKKKIVEKDITLRFRKNDAGFHNVEGRGSNAFGKYSISGTLTADNVITIFRHFQIKKIKASRPVTSAPPPINAPGQARRPSLPAVPDPQLKIDEVKAPEDEDSVDALKPPDQGTYSAVSRGVLRLNDDGSLSCQGKWAVTREHFTNGQTSNFTFRLEAHFAAEALKKSDGRQFPLDSEMYKGSFQLKKGGTRYQTVIDQQIVMKFRKNNAGSYNVYGKGVNAIGIFNLTGTLIMSGKTGGQVEVYRMYPPELLAGPPVSAGPVPSKTPSSAAASAPTKTASGDTTGSSGLPGPLRGGLVRRESSRQVKVPLRLEDDDPDAQLNRLMDKCSGILRFIREKDVERGAFFSEPVDPVALGIPTYHQVIREPMDLRTLARKMDAREVASPEEFARLARLVFENAMTFNIEPTHSVHQAARNLLILFNQKFRDVERMATTIQRAKGEDGKRKKDDKKRRRADDTRSLKRRRLDEAQDMAAANANSMAAIAGAVPRDPNANVSRNEFSLMVQMITQLQQQVVQTYTALAELSSDEPGSGAIQPMNDISFSAAHSSDFSVSSSLPERKKKKKPEPKLVEKPVVYEEDSRPLSLQEQELLTETINELPHEHLHGVIQIIREAAKISGEEEEIDLEIDQLDAVTQRKLLRHVTKVRFIYNDTLWTCYNICLHTLAVQFIKQPKRQKTKVPKKKAVASEPKREAPAKTTKAQPAAKKKDPDSFFAFGSKEDSDSDSEGEVSSPAPPPVSQAPAVPPPVVAATKHFSLGEGFGGNDDDEDSDDNEEGIEDGAAAATWTISQPETKEKKEADDDDGWAGAREAAAIAKVREEDKKKREEKMQAEAEQLKNQRLADAVAHGEEIKAQRQAEEEEAALQREQQDKDAEDQRKKAREEARAQAQSVEQTVDLDIQRDIMKQYEQSFLDKEMGSASPSSDFGF